MIENIQKIVTDELNTLTENDLQYCYNQWKKCWDHCVTSQGSYFEGENLYFQVSPIDILNKKSVHLLLGQIT